MTSENDAINKYYGTPDLSARILKALIEAGKDPDNLTRDDVVAFEEFHIGGRKETRTLAREAGLTAGMAVLDIGCGIGGPARTLAAEFGCDVTGLDLTEQYCRAAEMLTDRLGLTDSCRFVCGSALDLPFANDSFDTVWMQHVAVNVESKGRLLDEIYRVLRPEGLFVFHEAFQGSTEPPHYPVFWAEDESLSHLASSSEFAALLNDRGFIREKWNDVSARSLQFFEKVTDYLNKKGRPILDLGVIVNKDIEARHNNMLRNLAENRITVIQSTQRKP